MTAQENATLVKRSLDAFGARDFGSLQTTPLADNVEVHDLPRGIVVYGPKGFMQFHQDLNTAFPKGKMVVTNVQATDQQVLVEFSCPEEQNTGRLGLIPATGKTVSLDFVGVYEITGGKITKVRYYYDGASLMHQLGIQVAIS